MGTGRVIDEKQVLEALNANEDMMRAICRKVCGGDDFAVEEAMSDAAVSVWRNWKRFDGRSRFATWIFRVTYNAAYAVAKMSDKDDVVVLKGDMAEVESLWTDERYDPIECEEDDRVEADMAEHRSRVLNEACRQLSDEEKQVIGCVRQGLSTKETAVHLGLSVDSVRTTLKKAKRKLKRIIRNGRKY